MVGIKYTTPEKVNKKYVDYLDIETLKRCLDTIPEEYSKAKVVVERVEDYYFLEGNWEVITKECPTTPGEYDHFFPTWSASFSKEENLLYIFCHY